MDDLFDTDMNEADDFLVSGDCCDAADSAVDDFGNTYFDRALDDLDLGDSIDLHSDEFVVTMAESPAIPPAQASFGAAVNQLLLHDLDAGSADEFLRRVRRRVVQVGRQVARGAASPTALRRLARVAGPMARRLGPQLVRRGLPMLSRVVRYAGPWGRVAAAGLGATQALLEGRGWRGAIVGAAGAALPGPAGRIAASLLRGDGADDDAALDALADLADTRAVGAEVALPMAAALATRMIVRRGHCPQCVERTPPRGQAAIWHRARRAEPALLNQLLHAQGSAGQRIRVLRDVARAGALTLREHRGSPGGACVQNVLRNVGQGVAQRIEAKPMRGAVAPAVAARRLRARVEYQRRVQQDQQR